MRSVIATLFACAAFVAAAPAAAQQQAWPTKPIRVIEPAVPGSAVDVVMRRVTPKLSEALGQTVFVENRAGANSMIGAREAARMPADGYTIFHGNINNAFNDLLAPDPCCRLGQEFLPVTRLFSTPMVMVVHPSVPANTLKEYLELARSKPDGITFASGGPGSLTQMVGEGIKLQTGVRISEVPYKSIGAEVPDLIAGHVQTAFLAPGPIIQLVRTGKLKAIAVADAKRVQGLPNVPTFNESGLAFEATGWNGVYVLAGTPDAIVRRLQQEIAKALQAPDIQEDALTNGYVLGGESPADFAAFMKADRERWQKVIKDANIKLQ
jgi:tripartite-type tricarboxylate transporter receptor subunit TctC